MGYMGEMGIHHHYHTSMMMVHEYGYSLRDVEGMYPYEREVHVNMVMALMDKKEEAINNG